MTTMILPHSAVTLTPAPKCAALAPRTPTATKTLPVQVAPPANSRLEGSSPRLVAKTVSQVKRITTATLRLRASPAHLVATQRQATLANVSDVHQAHSQRPLEGRVWPRASLVNLVSSPPLVSRRVDSAHLVELIMTPIRPLTVWPARPAHTLAAARPSVLSAWLVRLTAIRVRRHHVQLVWRVNTGRLQQLKPRASAFSVLLAKRMPTPTVRRSAKTVPSASTVARVPSIPWCAQILMRSTTTTIHQHHV
eukprot:COSAG02_NODE_17332_length_1011_cov_9.604167_1_plen_251_part_00